MQNTCDSGQKQDDSVICESLSTPFRPRDGCSGLRARDEGAQALTTGDVDVEMRHFLTAIDAVVGKQAVARINNAFERCGLLHRPHKTDYTLSLHDALPI